MSSRFPRVDRAARAGVVLCGLWLALAMTACQKEQRRLREDAPLAAPPESAGLEGGAPGRRRPSVPVRNPYEGNAYAITEGQRLYYWYNCAGCHFRGGGGIGPPLMAENWRYGKEPRDIYVSIVDGRPNGMPSWRGKIPEYQVWQIVTFVEALTANRGIAAPPGPREEHLQAGEGMYSR